MRVAIIGAGISGLSAAQRLRDAGLAVVLYDKGRGPGGRTATRRDGDWAFDHGAAAFTTTHPEFRSVVGAWEQRKLVAPWAPRAVSIDARTTPFTPAPCWVGTPGMNAPAKAMAADLEIRTGMRVQRVRRSGANWVLELEHAASSEPVDAVIITTPPVQAVPLLEEVPGLQREARRATLTPCWVVMAAFAAPLPLPFDLATFDQAPLDRAIRNNSKPGRGPGDAWVLQATAEWSRAHEEDEPEGVAATLLSDFNQATGLTAQEPCVLKAHRWRYAVAGTNLGAPACWDHENRIGLAGDWCGQGGVEGAYLSGQHAATLLLASG